MRVKITMACLDCKQRNYNTKKDKAPGFDAQKDQEAKEARKKLKAAEKATPAKAKAEKKPGGKKGKKAARWLRDFRGEIKKIVWPDFKTVIKNTGIVLLTVVIIGIPVWILDYILNNSVRGLKTLAQGARVEQTDPDFAYDYDTPEITIPADYTNPAEDEAQEETEPVTESVTEDAHAGHNHD